MIYKKFGKLDWEISILGFGAMRLPVINQDNTRIDEKEAIKLVHKAIDNGVNYLDTAYNYHDGNSEVFIGSSLKGKYREKIKVATKLPAWLLESKDDMDKILDNQLNNLRTDHIDFYLLHSLEPGLWKILKEYDVFTWLDKQQSKGKIGHIGFSFHGDYPLFVEIIESFDRWVFCQIQFNYMDINFQAGLKGLKYAAKKGLAVIIMEPLRGGQLTLPLPDDTAKIFREKCPEQSQAELALKWIWNHDEVTSVLSGMSEMIHVKDNLQSACNNKKSLTSSETSMIDILIKMYNERIKIPCTNCKYCMPCVAGVNIPAMFALYNDCFRFDDKKTPAYFYKNVLPGEAASLCVKCGKCEKKCPQNIKIIKFLKQVDELLGA